MNSKLKNDLVKIVIDKLLIGILILIAGLYGNSWLEKYKSTQSFNTDIRKIQVQKIGEAWEALYAFEASTDKLIRQTLDNEMEQAGIGTKNTRLITETTMSPKVNSEFHKALVKKTISNRFWLGENQYESIIDYSNLLVDYMAAYLNKDPEALKTINEKRDKTRANIRSIRDQLLNE